ncbi:hypothetical protein LI82_08940 [Methanococcoides methylutens]|uniref:Uncharacterized protein n=1 Tax=Methanococcoides methylutens TaxID=2226 RepID=A0A099T0Y3_METMT|nr:LamG-like jellyroll fold domain-containing protein [Methanococcoides methylutens]KGK97876.1 hypothetical protein LI82_08940 [Methanococcoides methylutens]
MPKDEFSVTFWIRISENPKWSNLNSTIRFPPIYTQEGVSIFITKLGSQLRVFVLDPEIGYRKIKTEIATYIKDDTFVALVVKGDYTTLYLNGEKVETVDKKSMDKEVEIGDYVIVDVKEGDLSGVKMTNDFSVMFPAEVKQIFGDNGTFYFFGLNQTVVLPINRIHRW